MSSTPQKYDLIVIGSGLGGLLCAYIFGKEGYKVCVLEKNNQIGGSLQTFVRDKQIFDTGVHYVGGLDKGQPLHTFFSYFELMDKLKIVRMDENGFEKITFGKEKKTFFYGMGYENFSRIMKGYFPDEVEAINKYCLDLQSTCAAFPMYNADDADDSVTTELLQLSAIDYFKNLTSNTELQNVLAATNLLYAGVADKTPFYVHALVVNSYMESAYRFINGGGQIATLLARSIRAQGGVIVKYAEAEKIITNEEEALYVQTKDGRQFYGNYFISGIHPASLMDMLDTPKIRNVYKNRIKTLENTTSIFILNLILKKDTIPYQNYNTYHYDHWNVWDTFQYEEHEWPLSYAAFYPVHKQESPFVDSLTVMAYMRYDEVQPWENTFNTIYQKGSRGESYEQFKEKKSKQLIRKLSENIPGLEEAIVSYYASTPLTYRDYIGTKEGSIYGILKDYHDPIRTFIAPRTRVRNVLITGQNMHMHGIYGVTVSAVKTCAEIFGRSYLMNQIKACKATPSAI
ncbi:NAD(P)/FAD-dependent oxidoreductase [Xanthocytophaga agilis]|uniref:NAD(P)/FAD-dependent oxidoreductase n=1 Tax=Xanthocytophaga agilis TaxID=3048010 RepID=A0AAE3UF46_9BACT|nr:NAD(P)/FAD-dependent oxidoreductase [Xanthocytophaga agilis]MDJ1500178.1 NAD(P)/FAD-dependent oxidoreductase [Xanthocytophaga agilis]